MDAHARPSSELRSKSSGRGQQALSRTRRFTLPYLNYDRVVIGTMPGHTYEDIVNKRAVLGLALQIGGGYSRPSGRARRGLLRNL
jgi:hypothetical protein